MSHTYTTAVSNIAVVATVAANNNNTFIYGKSPLNATKNEFNNESNIKMVICYVKVRLKDEGIGCVRAVNACSSLTHTLTFTDLLFVHLIFEWIGLQ